MLNTTEKTNAGTTSEALADGHTPAAWVLIQARSANSGAYRLVSGKQCGQGATTPTSGGYLLTAGSSVTLPWSGAPGFYDLNQIYGIANGANDGVDISYGG